ncbi:head maturation protease, ClpP-related [Rhizobium sp. IMFF44]|uniref:head maturation protease, ClpP-related n=1 Tax=Rhizobium sp. IMFF44 TaxID=3342350 RepID=UPI0035BB2449
MNKLFALFAANKKRGSFHAEGNTIYLYDMIVDDEMEAEWFGGVSPTGFISQLKAMKGDVAIRVNSPGGSVFGAVAICQAMREYEGNITVHVDGYAASAASVIAVAAPKVVMAPGSFMMIHNCWTFAMGNANDMMAMAGVLEKIDGSIADSYAAKSGKDASEFRDLMAAETWFTAAESVAMGIADAIAEDKPKTAAQWDMSAFAAAPKIAEPPAEQDHDVISMRVRQHAARMLTRAA